MTDLTIFKDKNTVAPQKSEMSELAKSLLAASTRKRITFKNGKFRRMVNGELATTTSDPLQIIIINALPRVSREYYADAYDPDVKATLPNCWSELGEIPEERASDKQHTNCQKCPKNIDGSGRSGKGKACGFNRRIAILLVGDASGDIYQMKLPAKSLFGEGAGNVHPFESYIKFLAANGESLDRVVTEVTIEEDTKSEVEMLRFSPLRYITDEEATMISTAQADPQCKSIVSITVAEHDGVTKKPEVDETFESPKEAKPAKKKGPSMAETLEDWDNDIDVDQ